MQISFNVYRPDVIDAPGRYAAAERVVNRRDTKMRRHTMIRALLMPLGCCASLLMLPTSVAAQSFDCTKASTKTEKMICADPEISKLDTQMAERYKLLLSKDAEDKNGVIAVQARWLVETRNVAALSAELRQTYMDRLDDLDVAIHCFTSTDMEWAQIIHCAQVGFDNSDAELNVLYRKLLAQPHPLADDKEAPARLKNSQDAWLKFRDAECEWEAVHLRGGTLHPMEFYGCARSLTKERIKHLTPTR